MSAPSDRRFIADVRMQGFAERTTVDAALAWLDRHIPLPAAETASLDRAAGRVLAVDVSSAVDVPHFDRAMMDGYAVVASDSLGASAYNPLSLAVVGEVLPGRSWQGATVCPGQAVRIMTGGPMPPGSDAVLPAEWVESDGDCIQALAEVSPGKHVGHRGEDVAAGQQVLPRGRLLRPQDVGLLSSIGVCTVSVVRRPVVRIVVTGDELLPAGTPAHGHLIPDANGVMLAALVERDGGIAQRWPIVPDDPRKIKESLQSQNADRPDLMVVSGGSSVGQEDHAPRLLAEMGELAVHGIAMRPSSPAGMGLLEGRLVFLLPGNPVSCLCAYDFFAGRAVRTLAGRGPSWPYRTAELPLARKLISVVGRVDYARVRIVGDQVEPLAIGGASVLSSTVRADGFVVVPADSEGYPAGQRIIVHLYDDPWQTSSV